MARVEVSTSSDLEPATAWTIASDLDRFDEWMTIFGGWRSEVPSTIDKGVRISSLIRLKGFRNVIGWTVTEYDQPKYIELRGRGRGGVRLAVAMTVAAGHPGSVFHLTADMTGGLLGGPIGRLVA
ncbi:hypothetical protein NJB1907f44_23380 [Mycobacterium marinum]|nr:SRPBCC family protein [Mycobacterium marinum]GJO02605.1 hypothetical protein NJB1907E90_08040 [Mycobacterium marinum]GJO02944.1 hypothetical protein NJB1907f34b_22420 [Mycobacterium marinum]GJO10347.1 hypothetical protein NJB1907E11_00270 [Mycobacterium marinum]GJO20483.1 hypothetical protein NJB1907f22_00040 [Mycobacterium marinum]GJO22013.1 hypothetical protein NJB1728e18_24130 [Mycobacterium marinum]